MAIKFMRPEEVAPIKSTTLLYGAAGSGKSTFASTFPGPYYLVPKISANEMRTLQGLGFDANVVLLENHSEIYATSIELAQMVKAGKVPDCRTIVFDNLTSAQLMVEQELLERSGKKKLEWDDWNEFTRLWKDVLIALHNVPVNVVWITHSEIKEVKPKGGDYKPYDEGMPTLVGKSRRLFPSHADLILFCECIDRGPGTDREYFVRLKQTGVYSARIRGNIERSKKMPSCIGGMNKDGKIVDPTYDLLAKAMGWPSKEEVENTELPTISPKPVLQRPVATAPARKRRIKR